jgi:hypothetical protein
VLDDDEKSRLNDLLRRMVRAFEDLHGPVHKHHA